MIKIRNDDRVLHNGKKSFKWLLLNTPIPEVKHILKFNHGVTEMFYLGY